MAIYVPGVPSYMPNLKPFTPDYKFLSDVLTAKTNKYNTNYKAINDKYSQVVYADLSRTDTQELRDQYVNDLGAKLQKVSGMDLSVMQNVNAAKGLFRPFYEEDIIVRDLVWTKNQKQQNQLANDLKTSPIQEVRDNYWPEGIEAVNYKTQDFINASEQEALQMRDIPAYVENPKLYKRAMAYFKDKDFKIKWDELSKDGSFIVSNQNGEDVTPLAMADLRATFGKDPLIQQGYYTQSYVKARRYADGAMKNGMTPSVKEGMVQFNTDVIQKNMFKAAAKVTLLQENNKELKKQKEIIDQKYIDKTPVPGSTADLMIKKLNMQITGNEVTIEQYINSMGEAQQLLKTNDPALINARGYNIGLTTNIENDLQLAATNYSMQTMERTMKVNTLEQQRRKQVHDLGIERIRDNRQIRGFQQDEKMFDKKVEADQQLEILKAGLKEGAGKGSWKKGLYKPGVDGSSFITSTVMDTKNPQTIDVEAYNKMEDAQINRSATQLDTKKLNLYVDMFQQSKTGMISFNNSDYTLEDFRKKIQEGNKEDQDIMDENLINFFNPEGLKNNSVLYGKKLINWQTRYNELKKEVDVHNINKTNYESANAFNARVLQKEDPDTDPNVPLIYNEDNQRLTEDEYAEKYRQDALGGATLKGQLVSGSAKYPFILKRPNDPVWQKLATGEIEPYVTVKITKGGVWPFNTQHGTAGDKKVETIINPELIGSYRLVTAEVNQQLKDFYVNNPKPGISIGQGMNTDNIRYKSYGGKGGVTLKAYAKGSLTVDGVTPLTNAEIRELSDIPYNYTRKKLGEINTLQYHAGDANIEGAISEKNMETVNDIYTRGLFKTAPSYIKNTTGGDLVIANVQTMVIPDMDEASKREQLQVLDMVNSLQIAIENQSSNLQATALTPRDGGKPFTETIEDKVDVSNLSLDFYGKFTDGAIKPGEYKIEYNPFYDVNEGLAQYKLYNISKTAATSTKPAQKVFETIVVTLPSDQDVNNLNPLNDKVNYTIPTLIDNNEDKVYNENIIGGGNINIIYDNGTYHLSTSGEVYNWKTGKYETSSQNEQSFSGLDAARNIDLKTEQLVKFYIKQANNNLYEETVIQKNYNTYLKNNSMKSSPKLYEAFKKAYTTTNR